MIKQNDGSYCSYGLDEVKLKLEGKAIYKKKNDHYAAQYNDNDNHNKNCNLNDKGIEEEIDEIGDIKMNDKEIREKCAWDYITDEKILDKYPNDLPSFMIDAEINLPD